MSDAALVPVGMSADEARAKTDRVKVAVEATWELIKELYVERAWVALGYSSWDDYCTREFGTSRLRLPKEERQEVVASLRDAGLSVRAIAAATGVGRGTVERSLSGVPDGTSEPDPDGSESEQKVTGVDGKTYERLRQAKQNNPAEPPAFKSRAAVEARVAKAKEMAAAGYTSRQIAPEIGISHESMPEFRSRHGIEVPADQVVGKTGRHDSNRIVSETVYGLEGTVMALNLVEVGQLDRDQVESWVISLNESLSKLRSFTNRLKEMTQ